MTARIDGGQDARATSTIRQRMVSCCHCLASLVEKPGRRPLWLRFLVVACCSECGVLRARLQEPCCHHAPADGRRRRCTTGA